MAEQTYSIKAGDVVTLGGTPSGPDMTVEHIESGNMRPGGELEPFAHCVWFDTDEHGKWSGPHRAAFTVAALRVVEEDA